MKPQTSSNIVPKKKTKQQRIEEHAKLFFANAWVPVQHKLAQSPAPPDMETVRKAMNSTARASIEAAGIFDDAWQAMKGKYKEEESD